MTKLKSLDNTRFSISYLYQNYTSSQLEQIFRLTNDIIDNLDKYALNELFEGYSWDIDKLFLDIVQEVSVLMNSTGSIDTASFNYMLHLTNQLDEYLKKESFSYFTSNILYDFDIETYHLEWMNLAQIYNKLCILAARGHSKSFCFSFAYPLWNLWRYSGTGKIGKEILIVTAEDSLAKKFLELVKNQIEDNVLLRDKLYPGKSASDWGKERLITKNKATLEGKSANGNLRGRHDQIIICDDFLDEANMYNSETREKTIEFFHSVVMNIPIQKQKPRVVVVGTPFSESDLYANLKKSKGFRVFEYPAIYPDGSLLSPERFTLENLLEKKEDQGSIVFSREILVRPISNATSLFPMTLLRKSLVDTCPMIYNRYSCPIKIKKWSLGVDIAISGAVAADYCVFVTIGVDDLNRYWILNVFRDKGLTYSQQVATIKRLNSAFKYDIIFVENNQYQEALVQILKDNGLANVLGKFTGVDKYSFTVGIPAISVLYEQGRIRIPYQNDPVTRNTAELILSEFNSMTFANNKLMGVGGHDDVVAACFKGIQGINYVNEDLILSFLDGRVK